MSSLDLILDEPEEKQEDNVIEKILINHVAAVEGGSPHNENALDTTNEKNPLETEVQIIKTPLTALETVETTPLQNARNQMQIKVVPPDNNTPMQAWSMQNYS